MLQARVVRLRPGLYQGIPVEIDKFGSAQAQLLGEAAFRQHQVRIALMAGTLGDDDSPCAQAQESVDCCAYEQRARVHSHDGNGFH